MAGGSEGTRRGASDRVGESEGNATQMQGMCENAGLDRGGGGTYEIAIAQ